MADARPLDTPLTRLLTQGPFVAREVDVDGFEHKYVDADEIWELLYLHDQAVREDERNLWGRI